MDSSSGMTRARRRLRYAGRLGSDVLWSAHTNRMWWLVAVVAVVLVALLLGGATQTVAPYAVYTLF
jgi:hypothetical protein